MDSSKTEKATPKKRRDERKKGNVSISRDAVAVASLIGVCAVFFVIAPAMAESLAHFCAFCLQRCAEAADVEVLLGGLFELCVSVFFSTAFLLLVAACVCAVGATFFQTRMLVTTEQMKPKFSRVNPIEGFKRLFSLRSAVEALKGILKISILMAVIAFCLAGTIEESSKYLYTDITAACAHLFDVGRNMILYIAIAFVAIAAFDFLFQHWQFERQIRMSKQEIKEEYKQIEGDPKVKAKIKEIQYARAQTRMMQQVPDADVVIRNPTHYAVALRYKPDKDNAPIVLAKGQDELALRIVKVAEEAGVAVMENVALARALYAQTDLNREIPPDLYSAVAEILVYIFRLNDQKQIIR